MSDFWKDQSRWPPIDPPGFTFLGRAALLVGNARHGDSWSGDEPSATAPRNTVTNAPSPAPTARTVVRRTAGSPQPDDDPGLSLTAADREMIARWGLKQQEKVNRWHDVQIHMARAFVDGRLRFALRNRHGVMMPGSASAWNNDAIKAKFASCRLNPTTPSTGAIAGDGFLQIFVDTGDLKILLGEVSREDGAAWRPRADETSAISWVQRSEPIDEARRRAIAAVSRNPSRKNIANALARMWEEAGRKPVSAGSFEQYLIRRDEDR
jgi:hypothetical protein